VIYVNLLIKVIQLCDDFEWDYNCSNFTYFRLTQGSEFIISRQSNGSFVPEAEYRLLITNVSYWEAESRISLFSFCK